MLHQWCPSTDNRFCLWYICFIFSRLPQTLDDTLASLKVEVGEHFHGQKPRGWYCHSWCYFSPWSRRWCLVHDHEWLQLFRVLQSNEINNKVGQLKTNKGTGHMKVIPPNFILYPLNMTKHVYIDRSTINLIMVWRKFLPLRNYANLGLPSFLFSCGNIAGFHYNFFNQLPHLDFRRISRRFPRFV